MDGDRDHVKSNKPDSNGQILHVLSHVWNLDFKRKIHENRRRSIWEKEGEQKVGVGGQEKVTREEDMIT
jgi:hypothetical protein